MQVVLTETERSMVRELLPEHVEDGSPLWLAAFAGLVAAGDIGLRLTELPEVAGRFPFFWTAAGPRLCRRALGEET